MSRVFSRAEVARHNTPEDLWIIVEDLVFDLTKFKSLHPGGLVALTQVAGTDASEKFWLYHNEKVLTKYKSRLCIGVIDGSNEHKKQLGQGAAAAPADKTLSHLQGDRYGEMVPYGDPNWYQTFPSPYYNASHRAWRAKVRAFVDAEIKPNVNEWDEKYALPKDIYKKMADAGILAGFVGHPWPSKYIDTPAPENYDHFHELILVDELSRCGSGGIVWGLIAGLSIGLPPVLLFANDEIRNRVAPPCLRGEKVICLAISEPGAGSDVANLATTAVRDGDHFVVNGTKKWITNGMWADYFTVAVRTGGPGNKGLSFLLLEKGMPGLSVRHMKCMGVWASGTTFIKMDNVRVPATNLIGKENDGFKLIMYNFNHERWGIVVQANRFARICYEEAFKHAVRRHTFGKRLIDHQEIRFKLVNMLRMVESTHAWLEQVTYAMNNMGHAEAMRSLGGVTAALKAQSTKTFEFCAREAAQVFGGASYVRGGVGEVVERLYREVRAYAIPGGSEEIMIDLAGKQTLRTYMSLKSGEKLSRL